jgi:hypothetical protein
MPDIAVTHPAPAGIVLSGILLNGPASIGVVP